MSQETKLQGHKLKQVVYTSKKAAKIVTRQEEGSEFEQTIAFLELETQEIEDEVQNSLEEVYVYICISISFAFYIQYFNCVW